MVSGYFCVRGVVGYGRQTVFDRRLQSLLVALQGENMSEAVTRVVTITDLKAGSIRGDLCVPLDGDAAVVLALVPSTAEGSAVAVSKAVAKPELNLLDAFAAIAKAPVDVGNDTATSVMSLDLAKGIGKTIVIGSPRYCGSRHCNLSVAGPTKLLLAEVGTSLRSGRPVDQQSHEAQGVVAELELGAAIPAGTIPQDCFASPGDCSKAASPRLTHADASRLNAALSAVVLASNPSFHPDTKEQALLQALTHACPALGEDLCQKLRDLADESGAATMGEAALAALAAPLPACSIIAAQHGARSEALERVARRPASVSLREQAKVIEARLDALQENCFRERLSAIVLPTSWKTRLASLSGPFELGYDADACAEGHLLSGEVSALQAAVQQSATGLLSNPKVAAAVTAMQAVDPRLAESWCVEVERAARRMRPETFGRLLSRRAELLRLPADPRRDELAAQAAHLMRAESFFSATPNGEPVLVPMSKIDARVADLVDLIDGYISNIAPVVSAPPGR